MIEPELKAQLQEINQNLIEIKKKTGRNLWYSFYHGVFSALGYIAGLAVVVVILGWILQITGLLPAFKEQMQNFSSLVEQAKKFTTPSSTNGARSTTGGNNRGEGTLVLPDGREVKIQLQQ